MALIDSESVITIKSYNDDNEFVEKEITVGEFIERYTKDGKVPVVNSSNKSWILRKEIRYDHRWECPYCGAISYDITPYCCSCGKKIALGSEQK